MRDYISTRAATATIEELREQVAELEQLLGATDATVIEYRELSDRLTADNAYLRDLLREVVSAANSDPLGRVGVEMLVKIQMAIA